MGLARNIDAVLKIYMRDELVFPKENDIVLGVYRDGTNILNTERRNASGESSFINEPQLFGDQGGVSGRWYMMRGIDANQPDNGLNLLQNGDAFDARYGSIASIFFEDFYLSLIHI